ncbi:MAG TPA: gluconokinase [Candidatus Limnocylindria bacterium]|nr:gluconokinase [Candidatus Limnocylindria bacterium]
MAAGGYVVALDVGTSSVRAILHDLRARPVPGVEVHLPHTPRLRQDGTAEADADALANLAERALTEVLRLAGSKRAARIEGAGVSSFWHGLVAADDSARALTPVYLWSDSRSSEATEKLRGRLDAELVRLSTGCPIHPSYWPSKLEWLRTVRPDLWKRQVRWLSFADLLYWRWFGRLGTSLSMASGTGLFRLADRQWDDDLSKQLRLKPASLPPIGNVEQGLTDEFRRRWPPLADVPWQLPVGDGALANLGSGCITPTRRALTIGTSGALRVLHREPRGPLPAGLWCYRLDADRLVTGGALSNGGNLHAWLAATLRLSDGLEGKLRRLAPAAHGLTFLPHLAGERSLGYAPHAFGAIAGLTSATAPEAIAQAGLEAVAIECAAINRRLDEVVPRASRLVASGAALLSSRAWLQMMADAIGRPIAAGRSREASSRGAAIFAIEGLGLGDPTRMDPGVGRVFKPRPAASRAYRKAEARQEALYKALIGDRILDTAAASPRSAAER